MTVFDRFFVLKLDCNQEHAQFVVKIKVAWFVLIKQPFNPCKASHCCAPVSYTVIPLVDLSQRVILLVFVVLQLCGKLDVTG